MRRWVLGARGCVVLAIVLAALWVTLFDGSAGDAPSSDEGAAVAVEGGTSSAESPEDRRFVDRVEHGESDAEREESAISADDLWIRCLDAERHPVAGLEVELRALDPSGQRPLFAIVEGMSDAAGMARLARARSRMTIAEAPYGWVLWTSSVRPWADGRRLDLEKESSDAVEWILPSLAAIEVRVLDFRGEPVEDGTEIEIGEEVSRSATEEGGPAPTRALVGETKEGTARFAHLGLNVPWEIAIAADVHVRRKEPALTAIGECRRVEVRLGEAERVLYGRILDADSQPIRGERIGLVAYAGAMRVSGALISNASGLFCLTIPPGEAFQMLVRDVRRGQSLVVDVAACDPTSSRDLGDLTLNRDVELASGIVLGAADAPCPDATVEVELLEPENPEALHPLRALYFRPHTSDEDGRFRCAEPTYPGEPKLRYRLRAFRDGESSVSTIVEAPARDLVLRLVATGSLVAEVELGGVDLPRGTLRAELVDAEGRRTSLKHERPPGTKFEADELPASTYRLELRCNELPRWQFSLSDLVVPEGAACGDPRLRPLDLRLVLQCIEFEIVRHDPAAENLGASLLAREVNAPASETLILSLHGSDRWRALLPVGIYGGTVHPEGHRAEHFEVLRPHQVVHLRSALNVLLELDSSVAPPLAPSTFGVELRFEAVDAAKRHRGTPWRIGAEGGSMERRTRFALLAPGRYHVLWWSEDRSNTGGRMTMGIAGGTPSEIDVCDVSEEQRFVVRPPAALFSGR